MANFIPSPNMNLPIPTPNQDPGPDWADNINTSLTLIDQHNHSSGSGVPVNPSGININALLSFNSFPAANLAYASFTPQGTGVTTPVNYSLYVQPTSGSAKGDLFYQDGSGETIQITLGGVVNATSSGIASGSASASFISSVLVVTQSTGVGAPIDAASYILRYNGSYPTPSGNAIVLAAPASLSGTYQMTLPAVTPSAAGAFLTSNTSGVLGYTNVDNSTLTISSNVIAVAAGGINTTQIADGAVTQAKLAAPNYGLSASSGNFMGTASSPTTVGISATISATTGRPIEVSLITDGSASATGYLGISAGATLNLYFFRDSTQIAHIEFINGSSGFITILPPGLVALDVPSGGLHTFSLQYSISGGTATVAFLRLYAHEI